MNVAALILALALAGVAVGGWIDIAARAHPAGDSLDKAAPRWVVLATPAEVEAAVHANHAAGRSFSDMHARTQRGEHSATLELPRPDGGVVEVVLYEYEAMGAPSDPATYEVYREARFFSVRGAADKHLVGSLSFVQGKIHASYRSPAIAGGRQVIVDPEVYHRPSAASRAARGSDVAYAVFHKDNYPRSSFVCSHEDKVEDLASRASASVPGALKYGALYRSVTMALAATAQYGNAVTGKEPTDGSFKADTTAAMVVALNRVNEVYKVDLGVQFVLVSGNDVLISTNYNDALSAKNSDGGALLEFNADWILTTHGMSRLSMDVGHVFSTGGGGVAYLNFVCDSSNDFALGGVTGLPNPVGDPFYIDYVSHEVGHQMNGPHTFNGKAGNCASSGSNAAFAVEPGSGVTIMGYAGICSTDNIASNSIPQMAWISMSGMTVAASRCVRSNSASAGEVTISSVSATMTVPKATAFALVGEASSTATGAAMTFSWEDADTGAQAFLSEGDVNTNPLFRAYKAMTTGARLFIPGTLGNLPPFRDGNLYFRMAARDQAPSGGHWAISDAVTVTVDSSKGPFTINPPSSVPSIAAGSTYDVSWNVAETDALSANLCVFVSDDNDLNAGYGVCVAEIANDGMETITIPAAAAAGKGFIRLQGTNANAFFAFMEITITGGGSGLTTTACSSACTQTFTAGTGSDDLLISGNNDVNPSNGGGGGGGGDGDGSGDGDGGSSSPAATLAASLSQLAF